MSKAKAPRVFVPLTKVDEEQRLVYGTMTQEILDKSGEMMDYDKSKPNFEKWSGDIHTASGGLSKGNLRVMHGLNVAGKVTEIDFNDDDKTIEICTKVVDDSEWNKVLEGCYTGFSVGGKYGKKWNEKGADGVSIKKYEAIPNEVSLVDSPCVPSATFSLVKADGVEEEVMFKVAAEQMNNEEPASEQATSEEAAEETTEPKQPDEPAVKVEKAAAPVEPTNEDVATRAGELAKAANDGSVWVDHIDAARQELVKAAGGEVEASASTEGEETETVPAAEVAGEEATSDDASAEVQKVTPAGVKQQWTTTDGQAFDKKDDAVAHEEGLAKAAVPETEADKLRKRLEDATTEGVVVVDETTSIFSLDRIDDLHKAYLELELPRGEDGAPLLEKGMYTVSRFAEVLGKVASLAQTIKAESKLEADSSDEAVHKAIQAQLGSFGDSFMTYAKDQIAELVAGLDTDLSPRCAYDYYYHAAGEDNDLAKNVVEMIEAVEPLKDEAIENIEKLAKSVGFVGAELEATDDEELSPPLQKRFDDLTAENDELKKVAEAAVSKVEELAKRVTAVEDTPLPRAPKDGNVAFKDGDVNFLGKKFSSPDELMAEVHNLIKVKGPDAVAMELIKISQASGGQQLHLNR